jgi:hypothetical protein
MYLSSYSALPSTRFIFSQLLFSPLYVQKQSPSNNLTGGQYVLKQMPDIKRIVNLNELYGSFKRVAREMGMGIRL